MEKLLSAEKKLLADTVELCLTNKIKMEFHPRKTLRGASGWVVDGEFVCCFDPDNGADSSNWSVFVHESCHVDQMLDPDSNWHNPTLKTERDWLTLHTNGKTRKSSKLETYFIKTLEVELFQGMVMFIPAYWWYSIQYDSYDTIVCTATYNTTMNMVANMKHWILYFFQQQNIQQKTMKTLELDSYDAEQDKSIDNDSPENSREDLPEDSTADIIKNLHHIGDTSLVNDNTNISM
jgi:hypothetical protein